MLFGCRGFRLGLLVPRGPAQPALSFLKLVEPTCERQRVGRVETVVRVVGVLWSGLPTGSGVVSTQPFAGAHVLAQPALSFLKLVEPACERQRVGRVETRGARLWACGRLRGGFDSAVRFAHALAEPAWEMGPSSVGDGRMST